MNIHAQKANDIFSLQSKYNLFTRKKKLTNNPLQKEGQVIWKQPIYSKWCTRKAQEKIAQESLQINQYNIEYWMQMSVRWLGLICKFCKSWKNLQNSFQLKIS